MRKATALRISSARSLAAISNGERRQTLKEEMRGTKRVWSATEVGVRVKLREKRR